MGGLRVDPGSIYSLESSACSGCQMQGMTIIKAGEYLSERMRVSLKVDKPRLQITTDRRSLAQCAAFRRSEEVPDPNDWNLPVSLDWFTHCGTSDYIICH